MKSVGRLCLGAVAALLGFGGLGMAASMHDGEVYYIGLAVFALAVLFVFWLIKGAFDDYERDPERPRREVKTPAKTAPAQAAAPNPQPARSLPASVSGQPRFLSPAVKVWVKGGVIALLGLLALMAASQAHGGGWSYYGGIFVFLLCLLALFRLLALQFEDAEQAPPLLPVPEDGTARVIRGVLAGLAFIVALSVAAGAHGSGLGYHGGLIAAGCAVFYIFYLIRTSVGAEARER